MGEEGGEQVTSPDICKGAELLGHYLWGTAAEKQNRVWQSDNPGGCWRQRTSKGAKFWAQNEDTCIEAPGKEASFAPLLLQKCCFASTMQTHNLLWKNPVNTMGIQMAARLATAWHKNQSSVHRIFRVSRQPWFLTVNYCPALKGLNLSAELFCYILYG